LRVHIREVPGEEKDLKDHLKWIHPFNLDDLPCPMWQVDGVEEYEEKAAPGVVGVAI
tara:strand:+ start:52 stop:222 length:171 start_codon:yes stop_codon:yes gene_type:complete